MRLLSYFILFSASVSTARAQQTPIVIPKNPGVPSVLVQAPSGKIAFARIASGILVVDNGDGTLTVSTSSVAGIAGPAGAQGAQGATGPQGVAGVAGAQGSIGLSGTPGTAGTPGTVGPIGPAGPSGSASIATASTLGGVKSSVDLCVDPVTGIATICPAARLPVCATAPNVGQALVWNGTNYCPTSIAVASSLTSSLSPISGTVGQSSSVTTTATFTASGLTAGIVPSCTGMPTGVTSTYGTNPVATAGGTSVITFTASASATLGGPTTISCIGTSNATVSAASTFAITVTAPSTLTTSLSPTSGSVAQSNVITGTMTFVASNLSSSIVPSCTGQPAGVTTTFGTNPVAQGGGTSVITFTASTVATVGGPTTISCIGTSGATVSAAATFAITVTAKGATTPTLTSGGVSVYTSPQTLTGAADWFELSGGNGPGSHNWQDRKLGGTIFSAGYISTTNNSAIFTGGTFNWTDGTTTATSSKTQSLEVAANNNVSFTLNTDATARVLTVFSGSGQGSSATLTLPMSVVAHSSNIALTDVTIPYSIGRGVLGAFVFNYQGSGSAGETLTITINSLDGNMYPLLAAGKVI